MKTAMISSTSLDLPEHREQVRDACLREGFFPKMMESLPARDADAIKVSMELVDGADVYIGIFAHRYGHIPEGYDISITEMELRRAEERGIEILVFVIDRKHPITIEMVETGDGAQKKLAALIKRASKGRGRALFKSPEDLRGEVVQALSAYKDRAGSPGGEAAPSLHPPNVIPVAPEPYIAHPYSLLQTSDVIGRQDELNLLTDWVTTNKQVPSQTRLLSVVAIGGMGKSALTWKWFNDIAPKECPQLAGRIWWSFYESDAHFENFIIRALAYTAGIAEAQVRKMEGPEREDALFQRLDTQPFLVVLDGLERILLAYSRMDAARLPDDDLDEQTANAIAEVHGLPDNIKETYLEKHRLRQCADPRAGRFLRRLTQLRASRVLISTRLYPAELQTFTAQPWPGCFAAFLTGLPDDDALNLWRAFGVSGMREQLLPLFRAFGNYPLLLRALAGEVADFRPAPGDFDQWRATNPDFNPGGLPLKNAKTHVLDFALRGLGEIPRRVLHTIAGFRMPATWETLRVVLVGDERPCVNEAGLDAVLTELEDRGLVGWDKRANRYDLHPIVRGVVWQTLDGDAREGIYQELHTYFDAAPKVEYEKIRSAEDLTPAVELYHTLIGMARFEDALTVFRHHLHDATHYRLGASRLRIELLEALFPDGLENLPRVNTPRLRSYVLHCLAIGFKFSGMLSQSVTLYRRANEIDKAADDKHNLAIGRNNLSGALRPTGRLHEATLVGRLSVRDLQGDDRFGEAAALEELGRTLATRGDRRNSSLSFRRGLAISAGEDTWNVEGLIMAYGAQRQLWIDPSSAVAMANRAWDLAEVHRSERDLAQAARLQGEAALAQKQLERATERFHHALDRARKINLVEEELPALTALAEWHRQKGEFALARELLYQVWDAADRGPYPLLHADARNTLARIERDQGNRDPAITAATHAYQLAWCDGPPYAYDYGLTNAKKVLAELGAPEPELPPFDPSKHEPMPDVDLNPMDEFHVEDEE